MIRIAAIVAVLLWVCGCSDTAVKTEWTDPKYTGAAVRSVFVLCLPVSSMEKECEDEFVRQLAEKKIFAVPGYSTPIASMSRENAMQRAREKGINSVLVSRFLKTKAKFEPVWPESTNMFGVPDYGTYYDYRLEESDYQVFSTVLYDVSNGKAIWSANSDTFLASSEKKAMESYVKAMIKKMERRGLLAH